MWHLVLIIACTGLVFLSLWRVFKHEKESRLRAADTSATDAVAVSVLKPLCGVDDALENNLESFFQLSHANFELVFGVQGGEDPAIAVVERLQARYPDVRCKLVVHEGKRGINPKVANLRGMLEAVTHDVVVISDSNIHVGQDYLHELLVAFEEPRVGLVTSLFRGVGESGLGSMLENAHLTTVVAPAVALSGVGGQHVAIGKSMLFR
ncbi:MAG: glycosyltransferase, partial [Myxococcales bacterium]|nr:glycosyltransferase [Myxococcales bacterium]